MTRADFRRVGFGFWGSIGEWAKDILLCGLMQHHDPEEHAPGRWHCRRCGVAGLNAYGRPERQAQYRIAVTAAVVALVCSAISIGCALWVLL
jgi:hypothetical protein